MPGIHKFYLMVALVALALATYEAWRIHLGIEAMRWLRTTGKLTKAWVDEGTTLPIEDDEDTWYSANVRYHYKVGARWYKSSRLSYRGTLWLPADEAHSLIAGMEAGGEVDVHYDPRNPARAVLVPGSSTGNLVNLLLYLGAAAFAVWFGTR
jgi:hypothetical protein